MPMNAVLYIKVFPDTKRALEEEAARRGRNLSQHIREVLTDSIKTDKTPDSQQRN